MFLAICGFSNLSATQFEEIEELDDERNALDFSICVRGHDAAHSPAGFEDKYRDAIGEEKDDGKGKMG